MLNIEKYKGIVLKNLNYCKMESDLRKLGCEAHIDCAHTLCEDCKETFFKWMLEEYESPILDDVEKEYLSAVIRPFRKEVDTISKFHTANAMQYIYFQMKDKNGWTLPLFTKGTMYKGMVQGKHYTLQELGL